MEEYAQRVSARTLARSLRNARKLRGAIGGSPVCRRVNTNRTDCEVANLPSSRLANTFLIVMLVVNAALVLTPQNTTALGIELCVPAVVFIMFLFRTMVGVVRAGLQLPWRPFVSIVLNLMGVASGISLIMRRGGGISRNSRIHRHRGVGHVRRLGTTTGNR